MLKNKKETISAVALAAIAFTAVIIKSNTIKTNTENDEVTSIPEISMEEIVFIDPVIPEVELVEEKIELEKDENILIPVMPKRISFGEAFAMARTEFGSGSLFTWNGTTYTTSYAEELVKDNILQPDSGNVNIVLNTTLKGKKGEE
jgi:hypothetical protein